MTLTHINILPPARSIKRWETLSRRAGTHSSLAPISADRAYVQHDRGDRPWLADPAHSNREIIFLYNSSVAYQRTFPATVSATLLNLCGFAGNSPCAYLFKTICYTTVKTTSKSAYLCRTQQSRVCSESLSDVYYVMKFVKKISKGWWNLRNVI
jgi:hypothetical protein